MKKWVRTKIIGSGTKEDPCRAYIPINVSAVMMEIDDNACLCRVAGAPDQISKILADAEITQLTDEEARKIIKSKHPNSDLENVDVADPEIDEIARSLGIDPHIRADIQTPTRGKQLLQDQECYLMAHICEKIGLTKDYWDKEASKTTKWKRGIDIEDDIKDGWTEAHEFVLKRIREKMKKEHVTILKKI